MGWDYIFILAFSLIAAVTMKPKQRHKPPEVGKVDTPTAKESSPIPVVFGTRTLKSPNVVWFGDVSSKAIKSKGGKK